MGVEGGRGCFLRERGGGELIDWSKNFLSPAGHKFLVWDLSHRERDAWCHHHCHKLL